MLFRTSSFAKIVWPVTVLLYDLECVDIQLILEFKNSFGKYHPVFPKNPEREFSGTPCLYRHVYFKLDYLPSFFRSLLEIQNLEWK